MLIILSRSELVIVVYWILQESCPCFYNSGLYLLLDFLYGFQHSTFKSLLILSGYFIVYQRAWPTGQWALAGKYTSLMVSSPREGWIGGWETFCHSLEAYHTKILKIDWKPPIEGLARKNLHNLDCVWIYSKIYFG